LWSIVASVPPVYARTLSTLAGSTDGSDLAWEIVRRVATIVTLMAGGALAAYRDQLKQSRLASQDWPQGSPRAFVAR
jgi:hypothetical protein